jgi:hypothetical protein
MSEIAVIDGDGFDIAEPQAGGHIVGKLLKFKNDDFIIDKTVKLPPDRHLVATSVITAWVRWQDGKPIEHRVTKAGMSHPYRDELGHLDREEWAAGLDGQPADPFKDTRYLLLTDPKTGQQYTFITDSVGGRIAIADLKKQIANVRAAHPGALPVVSCTSVMMPTKFGDKPRPDFKIIDWKSQSEKPAARNADRADDIPF